LSLFAPPTITVRTLASGSSGNMAVVRCDGTAIAIDAGIPTMRGTREALAAAGMEPRGLAALLVSHAHSDHLGAYGLRVMEEAEVPILASPDVAAAARVVYRRQFDRDLPSGWFRPLAAGTTYLVGRLEVTPFEVSHDVPTHGFVVAARSASGGVRKVVVATDLGHAPDELLPHFADADVVVLEANYNEAMLRLSPRLPADKDRVRSDRGHLANVAAGRFLRRIADESSRLPSRIVLAHLSEDHNRPDLAVSEVVTHARLGSRMPPTAPAPRRTPGEPIPV